MQLVYGQVSEHCDCIVPLHDLEHLGQVAYSPVRVAAGDALQHSLQGALAVLHGVGVSDPGGGEGAEGGKVFGVLHSVAFWVQQNHQVLQDVQSVQHCLQRCGQDLRTCSRKLGLLNVFCEVRSAE